MSRDELPAGALSASRLTGLTDTQRLLVFLRMMQRIRAFELETAALVRHSYDVSRYVHLCCGHEAVAVGACAAVRDTDWISTTYRGHGVHLARGADPYRIIAEMLGEPEGYLGGRGGSMHLVAPQLGIIDAAGIVGGNIPIALGSALRAQVLGRDEVTLCFFGDGATSTGYFHESMNIASLMGLPIVFVCENNGTAVGTKFPQYSPVRVIDRAAGYAVPAERVDGSDVEAVYSVVGHAVTRARAGAGPTLIECSVDLLMGHFANGRLPDGDAGLKDPIAVATESLNRPAIGVSPATVDALLAEVTDEVSTAFSTFGTFHER